MNHTAAEAHIGGGDVMGHWPTVAASIATVTIAVVLQWFLRADPLAKVPVVGEGNEADRRKQFVSGQATALYTEGYRRVGL